MPVGRFAVATSMELVLGWAWLRAESSRGSRKLHLGFSSDVLWPNRARQPPDRAGWTWRPCSTPQPERIFAPVVRSRMLRRPSRRRRGAARDCKIFTVTALGPLSQVIININLQAHLYLESISSSGETKIPLCLPESTPTKGSHACASLGSSPIQVNRS